MNIKPLKACAVVNRKDLRLHALEIYKNADDIKYGLDPSEAIIEVMITPLTKPVFRIPDRKNKKVDEDEIIETESEED